MPKLIDGRKLAIATILMEARGEGYDGMLAVAKVIRNRTELGYASSGNVADTVLRPWQFSCWNTDNPRRDDICNTDTDSEICKQAERAWTESARTEILPDDAVLYHADYVNPKWASSDQVEKVTVIGRHIFYRDRG